MTWIRSSRWLGCAAALVAFEASAALLLYEPFAADVFPNDTNLGRKRGATWSLGEAVTSAPGWSVVRDSAALHYPGLPASPGSRGVARIANTSDGSCHSGRLLSSSVTTDAVYCSFIFNIKTPPESDRALLLLSSFPGGSITARHDGCNAVVWLSPDLRLLLGKQNAFGPTAGPTGPLALNTTYLVVVKYQFNPGANDDEVALYINPLPGGDEPAPALTTTTGIDRKQIHSVWLPQGTLAGITGADFGSASGAINMDEIRVGTTWADVTPRDPEAGTLQLQTAAVTTPTTPIAPGFASPPRDLAVGIGQEAGFKASVTGTVPRTLQWFFNDAPLAGATNATLVLPNSQFSHAGKYSLAVSNQAGAALSATATLVVSNLATPPALAMQSGDVAATVGQTAIFRVSAVGAVPMSYQWHGNSKPLPGQTNSVLALANVQSGQAGKYFVTVKNAAGEATSEPIELKVNPARDIPDFSLFGWATQAGGTTGGAGAGTGTVSTASEFLAAVESPGPSNILVFGTISIPGYAMIRANKTIMGLGTNAGVIGSLNMDHRSTGVSNVIIRNLHISNPQGVGDGDTIIIQLGAHHIWIDHCTLSDSPDGLLDIVEGSYYITISWCKFTYTWKRGHRFTSLFSKRDSAVADRGKLKITYHHNWWSIGCQERMPRGRFGQVHCFNNYYFAPGNNYCIRAGVEAQILVENNFFRDVNAPYGPWPGTDGKINASGNEFENVTGTIAPGDDIIFTPPYGYALDPAANIPKSVTNWAGAGKVRF
jgi:pectate lyase